MSEFLVKVSAWFKEPSNWLSLSAAIVSLGSFYLQQADPGKFIVVLPDRIGLTLAPSGLDLILPLSFMNTGASHKMRYVSSVHSTIAAEGHEWKLAWEYEKQLVSKEAWLAKHPGAGEGPVDYLDYAGRAFTFSLQGGASTLKYLELVSTSGRRPSSMLRDLSLTVEVDHDGHAIALQRAQYQCAEPLNASEFIWCRSIPR